MYAERLMLKTDAQGNLQGLPKLPPQADIEAIFLVSSEKKNALRAAPKELIGQVTIHGDLLEPAIPAADWNMTK